MTYSSIFVDKDDKAFNLTVFQHLWKKASVRIAADADLLLPSDGGLVPNFMHLLDPTREIILWRFRCRPMKRIVRYTQKKKVFFDQLTRDIEEQRDRQDGSGGLIFLTAASKAMVEKSGKIFNTVNKEHPKMSVLLHGGTPEPEKRKLFGDPDEHLKGVSFFAANTAMTVGIDIRDTPIVRAYWQCCYMGGNARDCGQNANRLTRPDPNGKLQCGDPNIYCLIPGKSQEEHKKDKQKLQEPPASWSHEKVAKRLETEGRQRRSKVASSFSVGGQALLQGSEDPEFYTATKPIFEKERMDTDRADTHFLAMQAWCHYKRYPMMPMDDPEWQVPELYGRDAVWNNYVAHRDIKSWYYYDTARLKSPEEKYLTVVCYLARAANPCDFGLLPFTVDEVAELSAHYGDLWHRAVKTVLRGYPLESLVMNSIDIESASNREEQDDPQLADPQRHPQLIKRLAQEWQEWAEGMIRGEEFIQEDVAALQAVVDAYKEGRPAPKYVSRLQAFVDGVLTRHGATDRVDGFWKNSNGMDEKGGECYVAIAHREEFKHNMLLSIFYTLQSQLKLGAFVHPKLYVALSRGNFKQEVQMFAMHVTGKEDEMRAFEEPYFSKNDAGGKEPKAATLDAAKEIAALIGVHKLQPALLSEAWSYFLPGPNSGKTAQSIIMDLEKLEEHRDRLKAKLLARGITQEQLDNPSYVPDQDVLKYRKDCTLIKEIRAIRCNKTVEKLRNIVMKFKTGGVRSSNLHCCLKHFLKHFGLECRSGNNIRKFGAQGAEGQLPSRLAIAFKQGQAKQKKAPSAEELEQAVLNDVVTNAVALITFSKCPLCHASVRVCDWQSHQEEMHRGDPMPDAYITHNSAPRPLPDDYIELIDLQSLGDEITRYDENDIPPIEHPDWARRFRSVETATELHVEATMHGASGEVHTYYYESEAYDGPKLCAANPSTAQGTLARLQGLAFNFLKAAAHRNYHMLQVSDEHWRGSLFQHLLVSKLLRDAAREIPTQQRKMVQTIVNEDPALVDRIIKHPVAEDSADTRKMIAESIAELLPQHYKSRMEEMATFNNTTRLGMSPRPPIRSEYDVLEAVMQEELHGVMIGMKSKLPQFGFGEQSCAFLSGKQPRPGLLVQKVHSTNIDELVADCNKEWPYLGIVAAPLMPPLDPACAQPIRWRHGNATEHLNGASEQQACGARWEPMKFRKLHNERGGNTVIFQYTQNHTFYGFGSGVDAYDAAAQYLSKRHDKYRCFTETMLDAKCKVYFDIDMGVKDLAKKYNNDLAKRFGKEAIKSLHDLKSHDFLVKTMKHVKHLLKSHFAYTLRDKDTLVATACREDKISFHIIVPVLAFQDGSARAAFKRCMRHYKEQAQKEKVTCEEWLCINAIDNAPYGSTSQELRGAYCNGYDKENWLRPYPGKEDDEPIYAAWPACAEGHCQSSENCEETKRLRIKHSFVGHIVSDASCQTLPKCSHQQCKAAQLALTPSKPRNPTRGQQAQKSDSHYGRSQAVTQLTAKLSECEKQILDDAFDHPILGQNLEVTFQADTRNPKIVFRIKAPPGNPCRFKSKDNVKMSHQSKGNVNYLTVHPTGIMDLRCYAPDCSRHPKKMHDKKCVIYQRLLLAYQSVAS